MTSDHGTPFPTKEWLRWIMFTAKEEGLLPPQIQLLDYLQKIVNHSISDVIFL